MQKNNLVYLFRIIFTYVIVLFHFSCNFGLLSDLGLENGLYIATDFFFIVSGYLLYVSFKKEKCSSGLSYTFNRIKKIMPYYLTSYALIIVFRMFTMGVRETVYYCGFHFFEIIGLHGIGLNLGFENLNNSTWFVSVMLISGFIIYECLKRFEDFFLSTLSPVLVAICISVLYRNVGSLSANMQTDGFLLNYALMRGFMEMCLGIYAYKLTEKIKKSGRAFTFYQIIGSLLLLCVLGASMVVSNMKTDFLYLLIEVIAVSFCFLPCKESFVCNRFVKKWSEDTMIIYLFHMFVVDYSFPLLFTGEYTVIEKTGLLLASFVFTTVLSLLFKYFFSLIEKIIHSEKLNNYLSDSNRILALREWWL